MLRPDEVRVVEDTHRQLTNGIGLLTNQLQGVSYVELYELYEMLKATKARSSSFTLYARRVALLIALSVGSFW